MKTEEKKEKTVLNQRLDTLRELYGINKTRDFGQIKAKIAGDIGVEAKTIDNYITGRTPCTAAALLAFSGYFSSKKDKDGIKHDVSIDYLLGRTDHLSFSNEYISDVTGLTDKAIDRLKELKRDDATIKSSNLKELLSIGPAVMKQTSLAIINFMLCSDKLQSLCSAFSRYAQHDAYSKLMYKTNKGYNDIEGDLYISTEDHSVLSAIRQDRSFIKAILKNILDGLLGELSADYEDSLRLDNNFPELFEIGKKNGLSYEETLKLIAETIRENKQKAD